jgi:membrane-associated phospholipid phosphatase
MLCKILKNNAFFLIPYLIILLTLIPVFILYSKSEIHLWINQYNSGFSDWFFKNITLLGNGFVIIILSILLLLVSLRYTVYILTTYLSTGLFTQILKRIFFENTIRPSKYFNDIASLHLVDGVNMLNGRSFPSGHASSAFALFLCFALISTNRFVKLACFIMACLVAFSRVYLSQHFLIDIYAGSLIGIAGAIFFYQVFFQNDRKWYTWTVQKLFQNDFNKA